MKPLQVENIIKTNFNVLSDFIYSINNNNNFIGSDKYLDVVIKIKKSLDKWINEINEVTEIIKSYYPPTKDKLLEITKNLYEVYKYLSISLSFIKNNDVAFKSFRTRIEILDLEAKQIQKVILNLKKLYLKNTLVN